MAYIWIFMKYYFYNMIFFVLNISGGVFILNIKLDIVLN